MQELHKLHLCMYLKYYSKMWVKMAFWSRHKQILLAYHCWNRLTADWMQRAAAIPPQAAAGFLYQCQKQSLNISACTTTGNVKYLFICLSNISVWHSDILELPAPTDDLHGVCVCVCGYLKVHRERQRYKSRASAMWMTGSRGDLQYVSQSNGCWGGTPFLWWLQ